MHKTADDEGWFVDGRLYRRHIAWCNDDHHADAHIERAIELVGIERAELLHKLEQRWLGP